MSYMLILYFLTKSLQIKLGVSPGPPPFRRASEDSLVLCIGMESASMRCLLGKPLGTQQLSLVRA